MPKTFIDLQRHVLNGSTMGTRWSAIFHMPHGFDAEPVRLQMAAAVDAVDTAMSTWKGDSDLNRLNTVKPGSWVDLPAGLIDVLSSALMIGKASGGAFDIGMGDAVSAWGFSGQRADAERIRAAFEKRRSPAHEVLEIDRPNCRARKFEPMTFDLNGIAKGYGVDQLAAVARSNGIDNALLSIDGELVALGNQPDGAPWTIAVEAPDYEKRSVHSILELSDAAVATSGDYRHWVELGGRRLSHTMDPLRGGPLAKTPASASVIAKDCMSADAWATAMMVLGEAKGLEMAKQFGLSVLFLQHGGLEGKGCGAFGT